MDETVSPVEAILQWTISKRRKTEGGFIGHDKYMGIRKAGVPRKRVGFIYNGAGGAARTGAEVYSGDDLVGTVTSGSFGPTVGKNVGMMYVDTPLAKVGTELSIKVRNRLNPVTIKKMPFTTPGYYRGE